MGCRRLRSVVSSIVQYVGALFPWTQPPGPLKGLAMATNRVGDIDTLGCDWWYVWGVRDTDDPRYVPMTRDFSVPTISPAPKYMLVGNEPNAYEYWGHTMSPNHAAHHVSNIEVAYPDTFLIVGNVSYDDWGMSGNGIWWLTRFLQYYEELMSKPYDMGLGVHSYASTADYGGQQMQAYREVYDGEMWLTEANLVSYNDIDPVEFKNFFRHAAKRFERYACYTNTQPGNPSDLPFPMDLVDDEVLTPIGEVYAKL